MRKELMEVREVLAQIGEGDYRYIEGSEMYSDVTTALATLDRLLNQDEAELVEKCAKEMCSAWAYNWDGNAEIDDDAIPDEDNYIDERPSKQTFREASTAALHAIGLIGSE